MREVLLDTDDLNEVVERISADYANIRIERLARDLPGDTRLVRSSVDSLVVDHADVSFDLRYERDPSERVSVFHVRSGSLISTTMQAGGKRFVQGDVGLVGPIPGQPVTGFVEQASYDIIQLDRSLFSKVAAGPPDRGAEPVVLTSESPLFPDAAAHMARVVDFVVRSVAAQPDTPASPLIAGAAQHYLVATLLATFPSTAVFDPTIEDRHDSTPVLLRRAMAYIDDNAHRDISLADIAGAVHVTPRALQYMFRKHRDCTPIEYVRRVRLDHAHRDLLRGDRHTTSVAQIARRWGFAHLGRFAIYYRGEYGRSPHETLHG